MYDSFSAFENGILPEMFDRQLCWESYNINTAYYFGKV